MKTIDLQTLVYLHLGLPASIRLDTQFDEKLYIVFLFHQVYLEVCSFMEKTEE